MTRNIGSFVEIIGTYHWSDYVVQWRDIPNGVNIE